MLKIAEYEVFNKKKAQALQRSEKIAWFMKLLQQSFGCEALAHLPSWMIPARNKKPKIKKMAKNCCETNNYNYLAKKILLWHKQCTMYKLLQKDTQKNSVQKKSLLSE